MSQEKNPFQEGDLLNFDDMGEPEQLRVDEEEDIDELKMEVMKADLKDKLKRSTVN